MRVHLDTLCRDSHRLGVVSGAKDKVAAAEVVMNDFCGWVVARQPRWSARQG